MSLHQTLYDKVWRAHEVVGDDDGEAILYIDLHVLHEVSSPQALDGLQARGRAVRRPDRTLAVTDHNVPTEGQAAGPAGVSSAFQTATRPGGRLPRGAGRRPSGPSGAPAVPADLVGDRA